MMIVHNPSQIGVRLPMGLRLWLELKASAQKIPTSTLIRQMIEAEARRDLQQGTVEDGDLRVSADE